MSAYREIDDELRAVRLALEAFIECTGWWGHAVFRDDECGRLAGQLVETLAGQFAEGRAGLERQRANVARAMAEGRPSAPANEVDLLESWFAQPDAGSGDR